MSPDIIVLSNLQWKHLFFLVVSSQIFYMELNNTAYLLNIFICRYILLYSRSRDKFTGSTGGNSSSVGTIGSISGYRKYTGKSHQPCGNFLSDRSQMYSDYHDDGSRSLPRYNVYDNRAYGHSETDSRYGELPVREQQHSDLLY
jgi:hypothetical protein